MDNCIYSSLIASCRFLLLEKIFENHDEYSCFLFFSKNPKYRKIPRMNPHIKLKEGLCEYLLGVLVANSLFVVLFAIWYHFVQFKERKKHPWTSVTFSSECYVFASSLCPNIVMASPNYLCFVLVRANTKKNLHTLLTSCYFCSWYSWLKFLPV